VTFNVATFVTVYIAGQMTRDVWCAGDLFDAGPETDRLTD